MTEQDITRRKRTISVDFDGVINSYETSYKGAGYLPDAPVPGAIEWLSEMVQHFYVNIFSTRCESEAGREGIRGWLRMYAGNALWKTTATRIGLDQIQCTFEKLPSIIYIDDRGYRFTGANFPSADEIIALRPWNKR